MPTLNWIGKDAVVNHHKDVPFRLLQADQKLSCGDPDSGNLIVQGDNLHALKALLPKYAGRVKCIYIDPPYNTGNEGWVYNDNVKAPEIKKWLGQVVGKEAEDLSRHDKWLCMMYPRLVLLKQFLSEDGAIFVSIDDNEVASLRMLMDEIFGSQNHVSLNAWIKRVSPANDAKYFSSDHEYVVIYSKSKPQWHLRKLTRTAKQLKNYKNPDNDPRGNWNSVTYTCNKSSEERPNLYHGIENPNTKMVVWPKKTAVWKYDSKRHKKNVAEGLIYWGVKGTASTPRLKRFLSEMGNVVPRSFFHYDETGHTQEARTELLSIVQECPFATPKPTRLIQRILQIATDKDSIILDSFAGSGTTGHAVLKQNAEDGGNRKFILVEMEEKIASDITAERVRRVSQGYTDSKDNAVEGLGSGFQFCRLSEHALFSADGRIREDITFDQLAEFIWFSETGTAWPGWQKSATEKKATFHRDGSIKTYPRGPLIGTKDGHAFILLYNGILADRSDLGGNVLNQRTFDFLQQKVAHDGPMTIFAARCRFGKDRLRAHAITYKQLPYRLNESL